MTRVCVVVREYPQLSQTYIHTELRHLVDRGHDVSVVSMKPPDHLACDEHLPYVSVPDSDRPTLLRAVTEQAPDVVHGHYLRQVPVLSALAEHLGVGWTVRGHSYDILGHHGDRIASFAHLINDPRCRGVLSFPFTRDRLEQAGVRPDKIVDCWPVVDVARFQDTGPNGEDILNVGACMPKKDHPAFLRAAAADTSGRRWNLYPLGYDTATIRQCNAELGDPITIHDPVLHSAMPSVYKRHAWLVYSASAEIGTVGWPIAVAEAQAAGVGVCVPRIRPDIDTYVGTQQGAGVVVDSLEDVHEVIAQPPSPSMLDAGHQQARRSDIAEHLGLLEQLWSPN